MYCNLTRIDPEDRTSEISPTLPSAVIEPLLVLSAKDDKDITSDHSSVFIVSLDSIEHITADHLLSHTQKRLKTTEVLTDAELF